MTCLSNRNPFGHSSVNNKDQLLAIFGFLLRHHMSDKTILNLKCIKNDFMLMFIFNLASSSPAYKMGMSLLKLQFLFIECILL